MRRLRLTIWLLVVSLLATACGSSSEGEPLPITLPDELVPDGTEGPTPDSTPATPGSTPAPTTTAAPAPSVPIEASHDLATVAQSTCDLFQHSRFADRLDALTAGRDQLGFALDDAMITDCPEAYDNFETLDNLAFNSSNVNQNVTLGAACGTDVTVEIVNNNEFAVDTGVMVQVGSAATGAVGGSVVLALGIEPGESRRLDIDPREVGTDIGASSCGAQVTAWQADTGPTATIFGPDDPIVDPGGRRLPQTRTDDPATFLRELIDFELDLFDDPDGAAIEEFEDVRSPNFLRLITEFGERRTTGERVEFGGGEISDVAVIERPRDDLILLGWTSAPATVTSLDAEGNEVRTTTFGTRARRGIFLRSPVDGRWRWVHSAFTIIEEGGPPAVPEDSVNA